MYFFLCFTKILKHGVRCGISERNGNTESAVKAAKALMNKCTQSKTDPYIALLEARNTPTQDCGSSPVQCILNRRTRSFLPMTESLLAL